MKPVPTEALAMADDPALRNDLGMALFRLGRTAEAQAEFESARAAYRAMKPVPNEALAMCVNNLATLHLSTRDGPSALACLKELPPATDQAVDLPRLINQGTALHLCGELDAAQAAMAKALDLIRRDLGAHHPLRIQALTNAAAIAADQHRDDEAKQFAREASSASRAWFEEVRAHADERQLLAMRRTFDPISPLAAFAGDDVAALADTVLAMKGVVLREALALRQHRQAPAAASPPDDAVFVDYVLHSAYAGGGRWETRYAALVIRPHEAAQWLPLGDAEAIHRQVRSVLDAMETSVTAGKPSRSLALQLQALWSRLLPESLRAMVRDQRVIIRPDGLLHFVPWAVLIDPKSPREAPRFLCQTMPRVEVTAFVHDLERVADKPVSWSVLTVPDKPARGAQATSVTQRRLANELASMPALPGTRRETEAIAQAGTCTVKHAATEADLRAALDAHPTVLHLACHAFALGNDAAGTEDDSVLTRSGLVLADASADGSGILFADEAAALPLSETNLVLLSACHTALGEADAGGDLTSMRHALLSAGARHVMSALWSVDDTAAPEFMGALYARLAKHESPSAALWQTQSEMLARSADPLRTASQCGAWNLESAGWER
jgi:CHAT domain-containing protein